MTDTTKIRGTVEELLDEYKAVINSAYCQCDRDDDLIARVESLLIALSQAAPDVATELPEPAATFGHVKGTSEMPFTKESFSIAKEHTPALGGTVKLYTEDQLRAALASHNKDAELYKELLYAVARKFPGETRHQTALKYIQEAERIPSGDAAMAKER